MSSRSDRSTSSSIYHKDPIQLAKYQNILVERFRDKIKGRGVKGFVGLRKQFRLIDEDGSGALSLDEFSNALKTF
jgi:hypothetical protein